MSTGSTPSAPATDTTGTVPAAPVSSAPVQAVAKAAAVAAVAKLNREKKLLDIFLEQVHTIAMSLLIVGLIIAGLMTFAMMLQQLLMALFLVYLILPVRNLLARYRLPGVVTYSIILIGVLLIGGFVAWLIQQSVSDFGRKWPAYQRNIAQLIQRTAEWIPGIDEDNLKKIALGSVAREEESVVYLRSVLLGLLDFSGQLLIVLVYVAFLLAEGKTMNRRLRGSFEEDNATDAMVILHRINASISKYISVKTFVSILVGASTTLVLWIFGVDYAIMWGIIAFVLNYIPYIGAAIAVVIPGLLAMLQTGSPATGLWILLILNVIHGVIGYWLEPVLAGDRLDLSPLVFIVSLAFWATVWGVVGMIMAVPLMVSIKIVLENIPATRPLANLLANVRHDGK